MNALAHQPPQIARANGIDICYEIFGDPNAEPMLLIMGLGAQMIHWDDDFCRQLAARGFRVIRFDNRDIGKSSKLSGGKRLTPLELLKMRFLRIPVAAPYKIRDMAEDVVGLMDALHVKSAHLVGASMGGMIAQEVAILFPQRVRSLTSIMSTTGDPKVPPPSREASRRGPMCDAFCWSGQGLFRTWLHSMQCIVQIACQPRRRLVGAVALPLPLQATSPKKRSLRCFGRLPA